MGNLRPKLSVSRDPSTGKADRPIRAGTVEEHESAAVSIAESAGFVKRSAIGESRGGECAISCRVVPSSCGKGEGRGGEKACPLPLPCSGCADLLHELSNSLTMVLVNAQLLEWKLPPYSHLRRSLRQVERNAQRATELLNRLKQRAGRDFVELEPSYRNTELAVPLAAVTAQEPGEGADGAENLLPAAPISPAPGFFSRPGTELTRECDPCTSSFFPKGDDGNEHWIQSRCGGSYPRRRGDGSRDWRRSGYRQQTYV